MSQCYQDWNFYLFSIKRKSNTCLFFLVEHSFQSSHFFSLTQGLFSVYSFSYSHLCQRFKLKNRFEILIFRQDLTGRPRHSLFRINYSIFRHKKCALARTTRKFSIDSWNSTLITDILGAKYIVATGKGSIREDNWRKVAPWTIDKRYWSFWFHRFISRACGL